MFFIHVLLNGFPRGRIGCSFSMIFYWISYLSENKTEFIEGMKKLIFSDHVHVGYAEFFAFVVDCPVKSKDNGRALSFFLK